MENTVIDINIGHTVLTYASSQVVISTLITAHKQGKRFDVIVVHSIPLFEAKAVVKVLSQAGISTGYTLLNGLSYVLKNVKAMFIGANAMLANSMLYSRIETAVVATVAYKRNISVVFLVWIHQVFW